MRRELREEQLLWSLGAQAKIAHETRVPSELHELRRLLLARASRPCACAAPQSAPSAPGRRVPRWTDLKLPCAMACSSKVTADRGTSLKLAVSHSSMELRSAWLGVSVLLDSTAPVRGLVSAGETGLNICPVVAVAVGAANRVAHDLLADWAEERPAQPRHVPAGATGSTGPGPRKRRKEAIVAGQRRDGAPRCT